MNTILAIVLAGAFAVPSGWLLKRVADHLFKKSAHPVAVGVFLLMLGLGLALVWSIYMNVSQRGWSGMTSLVGKIGDAVLR